MKNRFEINLDKIKNQNLKIIFFDRPVLKLLILVVISMGLTALIKYLPEYSKLDLLITGINFVAAVYFVIAIISIFRQKIKYLIHPKNFLSLISAYVLFILVIITVFAILFSLIETTKTGYLTYGQCTERFHQSMISTDPYIAESFFYFTSVTFFTVGYGDICPMGLAKILAIIVSFTGHTISVILVALILHNYIISKDNNPD